MSATGKRLLFALGASTAGAGLASVRAVLTLAGALGFAVFVALGVLAMAAALRWCGGARRLTLIVALTFGIRLLVGGVLHLALPVGGYDEPDDRAGFVFTDARRRDEQAWDLASSDRPVLEAFSRPLHTDQYGGLLAWSAFLYRLFSADAHRPLLLILASSFAAALGGPFLWMGAGMLWRVRVRDFAGWTYALFPESVLLGGAAMREPYLIALGAVMLFAIASLTRHAKQTARPRTVWWLVGAGAAMLLISPAVLLVTLVLLLGWLYFASSRARGTTLIAAVALLGLAVGVFFLAESLNRHGRLEGDTPLAVIAAFVQQAVQWDVYQLERSSGWVQKLFDEIPEGMQLPFVAVYGVLQPVLPAALLEPTTPLWRVVAVLRSLGWYALLPLLVLAAALAFRWISDAERRPLAWLAVVVWAWILIAALRGGGDQWDNPRYRAIMLVWQALLAGHAWAWWRETRSPWPARLLAMEAVQMLVFGQWYASRYYQQAWRLEFGPMVGLILLLWALITIGGWLWDSRRLTPPDRSL